MSLFSLIKIDILFLTDEDECSEKDVCPDRSKCINTPGSYSCKCPSGYKFQNGLCDGKMSSSFAFGKRSLHLSLQFSQLIFRN